MEAAIAQLGERQTEDLKVPGSIPGLGNSFTVVPGDHDHRLARGALLQIYGNKNAFVICN